MLQEKGIIPQIIERAFKGKPLTDEQKEINRIKSKTRCRVEHVFGFVTNSMNDFHIQSIGFRRPAKGCKKMKSHATFLACFLSI